MRMLFAVVVLLGFHALYMSFGLCCFFESSGFTRRAGRQACRGAFLPLDFDLFPGWLVGLFVYFIFFCNSRLVYQKIFT